MNGKDFIYGIVVGLLFLLIFLLGMWTGKYYSENSSTAFLEHQQYDPQYIAFEHEEMLIKCEEHDLEYSFEEGICIEGE